MRNHHVAGNYTKKYLKEQLQIEEQDIFKFNCNDISPDDKASLLLAMTSEDIQE